MKMRWGSILVLVGLILVLPRVVSAAADWDEDEDSPKVAKAVSSPRSYPGSADEQDLKVQATIPASGRYPDSAAHPEKARAVDDDGNPADD
jgi:hypothetical protein